MAGLSRVPAPHSPLDRWAGAFGSLLVVVIVTLAIEPWGSPAGGAATPTPFSAPTQQPRSATLIEGPSVAARTYRPEAFGPQPTDPGWAIHTAERILPLPSLDRPDARDVASGPVVDLGPAAALDVIVISVPPGAELRTVRLWRFDDRRTPERQDVARLAPPWAGSTAWTVSLWSPGATDGQVAAWQPGLYRLDLLIEPQSRIRMVMLTVQPDPDTADAPGSDPVRDPLPTTAFRSSILRSLPRAANLWTVGANLTGWARISAADDCGVADIWSARDPAAGCWAVPIGETAALGVNLPTGQRVVSIELDQVDPLPRPVALEAQIAIDGQRGVAGLTTPAGGLPDGIYRMTVGVAGGVRQQWYVEVGPDGRRVAALNAFATNVEG